MTQITHTVENADLRALHRRFRKVSPAQRRMKLIAIAIFSAVCVRATFQSGRGSIASNTIVSLILLGVFWIIYVLLLELLTVLLTASRRDRSGVLGQHTVTLTPEALHESTAVNESKLAWRGLYLIDATPKHIFIFNQGNSGFVIPRRAFPSPADAESFLATARRHFDSAKQDAQP